MNEHTKTPWTLRDKGGNGIDIMGANGRAVAGIYFTSGAGSADGPFVVRAVNAYDDLVVALREIAETKPINPDGTDDQMRLAACVSIARAALAKAETGVQP